jgi:hypothetical protein
MSNSIFLHNNARIPPEAPIKKKKKKDENPCIVR